MIEYFATLNQFTKAMPLSFHDIIWEPKIFIPVILLLVAVVARFAYFLNDHIVIEQNK